MTEECGNKKDNDNNDNVSDISLDTMNKAKETYTDDEEGKFSASMGMYTAQKNQ